MDVFERRRLAPLDLISQSSQAEISRRSGMAASLISNYASEPDKKGHKKSGEVVARRLEKLYRRPAFSWDTWPDKPRVSGGGSKNEPPLLQDVPHIDWGAIMSTNVPQQFSTCMPDDSMMDRIARGKRLFFDSTLTPMRGDAIMVKDRTGALFIRVYRPKNAEAWQAVPLHKDYLPLDSEADGLEVVAVLTAEDGRWAG